MNLAELTGLEKHASPAAPADWLQQLKAIGGKASEGLGQLVQGVQSRDPNSMGIAGAGAGALLGGLGGGEHWLRNALIGGLAGGAAGLYGNDIYNAYDRNRPLNSHGNQPRPHGFPSTPGAPPLQEQPMRHDFLAGGAGAGAAGGAGIGGILGRSFGRTRLGALAGMLAGGVGGAGVGHAIDNRVHAASPFGKAGSAMPKPDKGEVIALLGTLLGGGAGAGIGAIAAPKGKKIRGAVTGGVLGAGAGAAGGLVAGEAANQERLNGRKDVLNLAAQKLRQASGF